jgi:hypothetical protein
MNSGGEATALGVGLAQPLEPGSEPLIVVGHLAVEHE